MKEIEAMMDELREMIRKAESVISDYEAKRGEDKGAHIVELGCTNPGDTIRIAGIEMEVLDTHYKSDDGDEGVFCLAKEILFEKALDEENKNDWSKSTLRSYLNGEYEKEIEEKLGSQSDHLMRMRRDLTTDDGMKDYGRCVDSITLITCDEYRRYRQHISNKSDRWWTATAYSALADNSYSARRVYSDGSLGISCACGGSFGVVPAFLFSPATEVEICV